MSGFNVVDFSKKLLEFIKNPKSIKYWIIILLSSQVISFNLWSFKYPNDINGLLLSNDIVIGQKREFLKYFLFYTILIHFAWIVLSWIKAEFSEESLSDSLRKISLRLIPALILYFAPFNYFVSPDFAPKSLNIFLFIFVISLTSGLIAYTIPWQRIELDKILVPHIGIKIVFLMLSIYAVYFSYITVFTHNALNTHAYDLGVYDQVVWNTSHGRLFQNTFWGTRNFLGVHASIIWLIISPVYWIWSDPRALLILQSIWIALGAYPLYLIGKNLFKKDLPAIVISVSYLLFIPLNNANLFDVHEIAFIPTLFLFAFYFLEKEKYLLFLGFGTLAMLSQEEAALSMAMMGLFLFLFRRKRAIGTITIGYSIAYFLFMVKFLVPYFADGVPMFLGPFEHLGKGLPDKLATFIFNPWYVLRYIANPYPVKIESFLYHLLPSGFFSTFGGSILLLALPSFMAKYLGLERNAGIIFHYSAHVTPFIYIAAIYGIHNFIEYFVKRRQKQNDTSNIDMVKRKLLYGSSVYILASTILMAIFFSPTPLGRDFIFPTISPEQNKHIKIGYKFFNMIPKRASLIAQTDLVPHLSQREKIKIFPSSEEYEYILVDAKAVNKWPLTDIAFNEEIAKLLNGGKYTVLAKEDGYILFKKIK